MTTGPMVAHVGTTAVREVFDATWKLVPGYNWHALPPAVFLETQRPPLQGALA
jgi:hypothetical protein